MMSRYHDIDYTDPQILVQVGREGGRGGGNVRGLVLWKRRGDMGLRRTGWRRGGHVMRREEGREGGREGRRTGGRDCTSYHLIYI